MNRITELLLEYGLTFLFLNTCFTQAGAPIPALPGMVVAGALAADGQMSVIGALLAIVLGTLLADLALFYLGRRHGERMLKLICRLSVSPDACVQKTKDRFARWGPYTLLFAKFIPAFSTAATPLAGASGIGFLRFIVFASAGTILWAVPFFFAGFAFHDAVDRVLAFCSRLGIWTLAIVGIVFALYVAWKVWRRRRNRTSPCGQSPAMPENSD
jgi:membrane protein DedA with SNARE-associated domain